MRITLAALAAGAALALPNAAFAAEKSEGKDTLRQLGKVEKANDIIGRNIVNRQDEKIGDVQDVVVDVESGRILYALISSGGFLGLGDSLSAVPPGMLTAGEGRNQIVLDVDKEKLKGAPKFTRERGENLGDAIYVREVYTYYGQPASWDAGKADGKFGNVHRVSELLKAEVNNASDERIGSINNVALDLSAHRALYVILNPTRALDEGAGFLYALPPMAFTAGRDKGTLVTSLDKAKLASAPKFKEANWNEITTPTFAANVYRFYGKQLYFEGGITPTGRDDDELKARQKKNDAKGDDLEADRQRNKERVNQRNREREKIQGQGAERRAERAAGAGAGDNAFGPIIGAQRLTGWNVQGRGGQKIGTLKDLVIDLESGRILFGVIDEGGIGLGAKDNHAVAPTAFRRVDEKEKVIIAEFGEKKLADAPRVPRAREEFTAPNYVAEVYRFYGEQPWWSTPTGREGTGKFGHVHRVNDLIGMKVQSVSGEDLAKVEDVMVDLTDARVGFVMLSARGTGRAGGEDLAVPPMALTLSADGKTLTSSLEGDKLKNAPRVDRGDRQKLDNPGFATEIYRYYGKDPWWKGAATGRNE